MLSIKRLCITSPLKVLTLLLPQASVKLETAPLRGTRHATAAG